MCGDLRFPAGPMIPSPLLVRLALLWLIAAVAASIWAELSAALAGRQRAAGRGSAGRFAGDGAPRARIESAPGAAGIGTVVACGSTCACTSPTTTVCALACEVFDHHPRSAQSRACRAALAIPAGGWAEFSYRLRPSSRGDLHFGPVELRLNSPLTLWQAPGAGGRAVASARVSQLRRAHALCAVRRR